MGISCFSGHKIKHPKEQKTKMNSFIALTFLTACLFATANAAYDCPELAKDFYGNDIVYGYGLASDWKTCAKFCKAIDSCKYWTWLVDTVGKKCCLKTSDSGLTSLKWPGASGAKENCCGEDDPNNCK